MSSGSWARSRSRDESGPLALGGQKQRALLAALLLEAGRVVATDRLVDLLWGEEAPKTATTSLQNSISRLRRGARRGRARTPGRRDTFSGSRPSRSTRGGSRLALRDARRAGAEERRELLSARSSSGAAPRSPTSRSSSSRRRRSGGSRSSGSWRSEERIEADLELGRHGDVVGELEALVSAHPLRETLRRQLMLALYRSGRQAEALDVYQDARTRFVEELGHRAGPGAEAAPGGDPASRGGHRARPARHAHTRTTTPRSSRRCSPGGVVPVLGLDGVGDLAAHLASAFSTFPTTGRCDLARVSQYVATMKGSGPLYDELHARFEAAVEPTPLHRFLAQLAGAPARARSAAPADRDARTTTSHSSARSRRPARRSTSSPTSRQGRTAAVSGTAPPGRGAAADRRSEHLRDRALARAADDPAQAARRRRPAPRAGVGELRHHRGRLHRLPRALRADRRRAGRARREAAAEPLPLPRLRDGRLEPARSSSTGSGASGRSPTARGRCSDRRARSRGRSGGGTTSTRARCRARRRTCELLERRLEAA